MPKPLTISEVARRLKRTRMTVRRRVELLRLRFEVAMTDDQFLAIKEDFASRPTLPRGSLR